jgi:hypothetical protein
LCTTVAGYDLLYWTDVQRAGGLIDTTLNPTLVPPASPVGPTMPDAGVQHLASAGAGI